MLMDTSNQAPSNVAFSQLASCVNASGAGDFERRFADSPQDARTSTLPLTTPLAPSTRDPMEGWPYKLAAELLRTDPVMPRKGQEVPSRNFKQTGATRTRPHVFQLFSMAERT